MRSNKLSFYDFQAMILGLDAFFKSNDNKNQKASYNPGPSEEILKLALNTYEEAARLFSDYMAKTS